MTKTPTLCPVLGTRISYRDASNPQATGTVTAVDTTDPYCTYEITWDDPARGDANGVSFSDCRQAGWSFADPETAARARWTVSTGHYPGGHRYQATCKSCTCYITTGEYGQLETSMIQHQRDHVAGVIKAPVGCG